eukprot:gene36082-46906_t
MAAIYSSPTSSSRMSKRQIAPQLQTFKQNKAIDLQQLLGQPTSERAHVQSLLVQHQRNQLQPSSSHSTRRGVDSELDVGLRALGGGEGDGIVLGLMLKRCEVPGGCRNCWIKIRVGGPSAFVL